MKIEENLKLTLSNAMAMIVILFVISKCHLTIDQFLKNSREIKLRQITEHQSAGRSESNIEKKATAPLEKE